MKKVSLQKKSTEEREEATTPRLIRTHGTFHCVHKHEGLILMITGGLTVVLFVALITRLGTQRPGLMQVIYGAADFIDVMIDGAGGIITGTIFAAISTGRFYRCELTDDAFIVTDRRGRSEYFYYREITDIRIEEMKLFRRRRGWRVSIETEIKTTEYPIIFNSDRFTDITDTPFYYLMVNTGFAEVKHIEKPTDEPILTSADGEEYSPLEKAFVAQYQADKAAEREKERSSRRWMDD